MARSPSRQPSRLARRSVETLREGGTRALLWQALATAGARRLEIHCRPAEREPAGAAEAVEGVTIRPLSNGEANVYRALRPDPEISEAEFLRRLRAGDRCIGAWREERLVGSRWLAADEARVSYLGVSFTLAPDACYFYEAFTAPEQRRRGIGNLLAAAASAEALSLGKTKALSVVLPENRTGVDFIRTWSQPLGVVASVRLGRWKVARTFVPPGYIGRVRPLQRGS